MNFTSEEHTQGFLLIENLPFIQEMDLQDCALGLQTSDDGRIWVCINGVAFLRFKPTPDTCFHGISFGAPCPDCILDTQEEDNPQ